MTRMTRAPAVLATAAVLVLGLGACRGEDRVEPLPPVGGLDPAPIEETTDPPADLPDAGVPDPDPGDLPELTEPEPGPEPPPVDPEPEPPSEPELNLPYEPYDPPPIPGTDRCLYAGDPLCDTTIDVPPPNLDPW